MIIIISSLKPQKHLWIDAIVGTLILVSSENCDHEEASKFFVAPDGAAPSLKNCVVMSFESASVEAKDH